MRHGQITPPRVPPAAKGGVILRPSRPNPSIVSDSWGRSWHCPICGGSTVDWGVERRRLGRRPWKRLVHVRCGGEP